VNRYVLAIVAGLILILLAWFWLWPFPSLWHQATTTLNGRTPNQMHNLQRAVSLLNKTVVLPGATFSFNRVAGPYSFENGYLPDKSFLGGQLISSPGGGVCQLSSTLYYALLEQGFTCQRVAHGAAIRSIPMGLDATVADHAADLSFVNRSLRPLQIRSSIAGNRLFVGLHGSHPKPARVAVRTQSKNLGDGRYAVWVWAGEKLISHDIYQNREE
jgi:vancomycin resistance protein YoaR